MMMISGLLDGLNPEQREAVTTTEGYVRVAAGAGSGKTKALTRRFAYLTEALGVSTAGILCVTFTNRAAAEMKQRIRGFLPDRDLGYITTFHSFAVTLLKEDCRVVQYPAAFVVLDNGDREDLLKTVFQDLRVSSRELTVREAADYIAAYKSGHDYVPLLAAMDPEELRQREREASSLRDRVMYRYFYEQRKCFGLDFDDLLLFALYVLRRDPAVLDKWQKRLEYIMIDEFQDIDKDEYALVELLSGYHRNLFVVGDPDQTIYSWRGADVKFMLEFDLRHPGTRTICLNRNYRSVPEILRASNALIRRNKLRMDKELTAVRPSGARPLYFHARSQEEEADWIAGQMLSLREAGLAWSDMAVLYRAHFLSRTVEEALVRRQIPYVLYSGVEFYKRQEVKDVLCYLRMLTAGDDLAFLRTVNEPRRSVGRRRIEFLKGYAAAKGLTLYAALRENLDAPLFQSTRARQYVCLIEKYRSCAAGMRLTDLLARILAESGYEEALRLSGEQERLDNLTELRQSVFEYETTAGEETTLADYLNRAALFTNLDQSEKSACVRLMTVHAAKGLEFPAVFLCGLSEGQFPSKKTLTREKMEEERRLAYVAATRARDRLYLCDAGGYLFDGSVRMPSRFIFDAGRENIDYVNPLDPELEAASRAAAGGEDLLPSQEKSPRAFVRGDRVRHAVFGEGTIVNIISENNSYVIQFDALSTPRNITAGALA